MKPRVVPLIKQINFVEALGYSLTLLIIVDKLSTNFFVTLVKLYCMSANDGLLSNFFNFNHGSRPWLVMLL